MPRYAYYYIKNFPFNPDCLDIIPYLASNRAEKHKMNETVSDILIAANVARVAKSKTLAASTKKRRSDGKSAESPVDSPAILGSNEVEMTEDLPPSDLAGIQIIALTCDYLTTPPDLPSEPAVISAMPHVSVSAPGMKSLYALFTPVIPVPVIPIVIDRPGFEDFPIHIVDGRKRVRIEFFKPGDIREIFSIGGRTFPFEVTDREVPLFAVAALRNDVFNSAILCIVGYTSTKGKVVYDQVADVGSLLLAELISGGPGCLESVLASAPDWFSASLAKAMRVADDLAFWTLT